MLMCLFPHLWVCSSMWSGVRICHSNQAAGVIWSILVGCHIHRPPRGGQTIIPFMSFTTTNGMAKNQDTPSQSWLVHSLVSLSYQGRTTEAATTGGVQEFLWNSAWHWHHGTAGRLNVNVWPGLDENAYCPTERMWSTLTSSKLNHIKLDLNLSSLSIQ